MDNLNVDYKKNIRIRMAIAGLNGTDLAKKAGTSQSYLSEVLHPTGKHISTNMLAKIARALDCQVMDLLTTTIHVLVDLSLPAHK